MPLPALETLLYSVEDGIATPRIFRSLKPVIGAINGAAVGIGVTMQLPSAAGAALNAAWRHESG